jgi:hypothetical protein
VTREEAEKRTILRCEVGSTAHGISIGSDDRDEMGVLVEPMTAAMGIHQPFEQFIYRSAAEREGKHDAPSKPGDLDLTLYSLRKYLRLALKGNPTILNLLFAPMLESSHTGTALRNLAPFIIARSTGKAFLGYMEAQRQRLLGERGGMGVTRKEIVAKHGFDTKFASHMLRLGMQGNELLTTGRMSLPMVEEDQMFLRAVRRGEVDLQECLTRAGTLESDLHDLIHHGPLQETPNERRVEAWMIEVYFQEWQAERDVQ